MISEKAVEAAARSLARSRGFDPEEVVLRNGDRQRAWRSYLPDARAALSAALPVLLEGKREEIARAAWMLATSDEDPAISMRFSTQPYWDKAKTIRAERPEDICGTLVARCYAFADAILTIMGESDER